jgi:urease accessory protein
VDAVGRSMLRELRSMVPLSLVPRTSRGARHSPGGAAVNSVAARLGGDETELTVPAGSSS